MTRAIYRANQSATMMAAENKLHSAPAEHTSIHPVTHIMVAMKAEFSNGGPLRKEGAMPDLW